MNARAILLGPALVVLVGCQSPVSTTDPTPVPTPVSTAASGVEGLVADLKAGGIDAKIGDPFMSEPIGGQGTAVCVGVDTISVYTFIDHEAALVAYAKIDPDDPSHVGNGIVEWIGPPRFWLRDRIIVLYTGDNPATDEALRTLLGRPFAASGQPGRGLLEPRPCQ